MPEQWVSGAVLAWWETHLSCKSRCWEMEKSSEKTLHPPPDRGERHISAGPRPQRERRFGEPSSSRSWAPFGNRSRARTLAALPSPGLEQPVPLPGRASSSRGWQPPGRVVTVTRPWPRGALFTKGLMFSH